MGGAVMTGAGIANRTDDGGLPMFRLIKLAFYAMIGYVIYELVQGIRDADHQGPLIRSFLTGNIPSEGKPAEE